MSESRWKRLNMLIDILIDAYPHGISTAEAAKQLNVTRQAINNYKNQLEEEYIPIVEPYTHRYAINPRNYLRPLQLTLPQAWMLYLPLRRMVRAQMHHHQVVHTLLQRLTLAFDSVIGGQLLSEQSIAQPSQEASNFIDLVNAWRDHYWTAITYKPLNKPESRHLIAPYWFEPAVWSDSLYVIAGIQNRDSVSSPVVLKLDRIQSVRLRPDTFDPPPPQDILSSLTYTWGVWDGGDPVQVTLRFHNRQRQRLLETCWHPTEHITEQTDGSVIWTAMVSEPQEMVPWVRGWGPDVEVLEPVPLRDQIAMDAERTATLYGLREENNKGFLSMRRQNK